MKLFSISVKGAAIAGLISAISVVPAHADPATRGLQGVIGGAIIGGVLGGGKGAGRGAAIGGAVGVLSGAIERSEERRRARYYDERDRVYYIDQGPASSPLIRHIQSALIRLGYRPGPLDGVMGKRTASAIGEYQDEHGLLVTGRPSRALLRHMKSNGG